MAPSGASQQPVVRHGLLAIQGNWAVVAWPVFVTSRASALAVGALGIAAVLGCGPQPVEARAVWVDGFEGLGHRRVHVYDRGQFDDFAVLGGSEPTERLRLDPRGRGVLIRSGERRGAWFDLDDGRRMPLLLPPSSLTGQSLVSFAHEALVWIDPADGSLAVVPLAPWLPLARREDGIAEPLVRAGTEHELSAGLAWTVAAARAPVLLTAERFDGRASFVRYPIRPDQPLVLALEATATGLNLPEAPRVQRSCETSLDCYVEVGVDPAGELAIFATSEAGPWQQFDRRSPSTAGPLALPLVLAEVRAGAGLRLLQLLDRRVSIWIGADQLYRYDRVQQRVDNLPLFGAPPLAWFSVADGSALVLISQAGPVYRASLDGLRVVNLETTECAGVGDPVVSPRGHWAAWTCVNSGVGSDFASGVIVRVSSAGLERLVGVPMVPVAIDDHGALLLYSTAQPAAEVNGVAASGRPRNLFVLDPDSVLTRIHDLEPGPAPVLIGAGELAVYLQGVALGVGRAAIP